MRQITFYSLCLATVFAALACSFAMASEKATDELLQTIVRLIGDKDRDFRAAGLDQVRSGAKGTAATKLFSEQLSKLPAENQVLLLNALSDRGDTAAKPAVLELQKSSQDDSVRAAVLLALGRLGDLSDLSLLIDALASKSELEKGAARKSLTRLHGDEVTKQLSERLAAADPIVKASLIEILATRRAKDAIPSFVAATVDDTATVRGAAMTALGQIASSDQLAQMLPGVLKAVKGGERDAAEKSVAAVCARIDKEDQRSKALIDALETIPAANRDELLSLLGRVGGKKIIDYVGQIAKGDDASRRKLAIDALSKWPDASVANMLSEITKNAKDSAERNTAFQAYVKVCANRDKRKDDERLNSLKKAFEMANSSEEKSLVINRCRTAYHVDTLRFVLPYVADAKFAQIACETIVELAHHREIRDPNKAEFDKALDQVIATSKNATVVERAKAYKKGETWSRS